MGAMSILVIENNEGNLKNLLSNFITKTNHIIATPSYKEAIRLIEGNTHDFDIIITESNFSRAMDVTGFSTILSQKYNQNKLPTLVVYSPEGYDFLLSITRACNYPKVNFLQKPNINMLKKMIESIYAAERYTCTNNVADKNASVHIGL